ncbi:MAG: AAA family ATPase [Chloroflexi bacterium]|nr:AAA family ATPase [Chloroflexota bacterium]
MGKWLVTGQERVAQMLRGAIERNRVAHAYLLIGHSGCGKTATARNFAQALNCERAAPPCQECRSCLRIAHGEDFDVREIDVGEKHQQIHIDQVREIERRVSLKATSSKYKITIVPRAELFSREAADALLKILEEPPPRTIMILGARTIESVPETLASRCIQIRMTVPAKNAIAGLLSQGGPVAESDRNLILDYAEGRPRWAVEMAADPELLEDFKQRLMALEERLSGDATSKLGMAYEIGSQRKAALEELELLAGYHGVVARARVAESIGGGPETERQFYEKWAANLNTIRAGINALSANTMVASTLDDLFLDLDEIPGAGPAAP